MRGDRALKFKHGQNYDDPVEGRESAHTPEQAANQAACMQRLEQRDFCGFCGGNGDINIRPHLDPPRAVDYQRCPYCGGTAWPLLGDYELDPLQQNFVQKWVAKWEQAVNHDFESVYPFKSQQANRDYWWGQWLDWDQEYDARHSVKSNPPAILKRTIKQQAVRHNGGWTFFYKWRNGSTTRFSATDFWWLCWKIEFAGIRIDE